MDLELTKVGKSRIRVDIWFANRKQMACLRTICSHIENMFKGVLYVSVCIWEVSVFSGCHWPHVVWFVYISWPITTVIN